ncbi:SDR family NAD(P)-dependent oxidoreductase [Phytohabitans kaempferiae]|uniref:SDR family NAD(P)-dependent oxidoreductase n=1 Tax=Phytohabitans kaempferiae TaxID=1620943 RepID=A0ABV6MGZ1_9ACTN
MTGFLFAGQGAQRLNMGSGLLEAFPAFAEAFDGVCAELDPHLDRPLREVIADGSGGLLDLTGWAQPALFAVEVALFRLLESWGVVPDFLLGHSVGELAAAHVAGVWSLPDACRLVAARARLMQSLPTGGVMAAVQASETEVRGLLSSGVDVAAVNSPGSVVVSGDEEPVAAVEAHFVGLGRRVKRLPVSHAFHSVRMEPMLAEFARVAESLSYAAPTLSVVSNLTGRVAAPEALCDPGYWVRQVREPVRFADGVATLAGQGVTRFVELGPDATLTALAGECLGQDAVLVPVLRKDRPEPHSAVTALARLHVHGASVDWTAVYAGHPARHIPLPTYAFQHQRYWLETSTTDHDPTSLGLRAIDHPMLTAATVLADSDGLMLSGRISLATHSWLADHTVGGTVLFPGTALVELAITAGERAGCPRLRELILHAPLVLPTEGSVRVQVVLGAPDAAGTRTVGIFSCASAPTDAEVWVRQATGVLAVAGDPATFTLAAWPPAGAVPLPIDGTYEELADLGGLVYGPVFQGLRRAWRRGDEVFAEVSLPEHARFGADPFGLHPAVFDAALHAIGTLDPGHGKAVGGDELSLPYSWSDVELHASGAAAVRVRITPLHGATDTAGASDGATTVSLELADLEGMPVASVGSLMLRPVSPEHLAAAGQSAVDRIADSLFQVDWLPITLPGPARVSVADFEETPEAGVAADVVVLRLPGGADVAAARAATHRALAVLQRWSDDDRFASTRLVLLTVGAQALPGERVPDLGAAAAHGLFRTARSEYPGRVFLVDTDDEQRARDLVTAIVASGETEVILRGDRTLVARLARARAPQPAAAAAQEPVWDGTVLVSGGTGALGRATARHLVARHGVRRLLLVSRSGDKAPGAAAVAAELAASGAEVEIVACDLADRRSAAELLASREVTAVVHAAGVLDDGVISALTPDRIDTVFAAKAEAAWHLHDLTKDRDLTAFVLFSSAAGVFGAPGQGNYAAANAFLDALAAHRRAAGLVAQSLAWGQWALADGMGGDRSGRAALSEADGLALFDAAATTDRSLVVPIRLDLAALRGEPDRVPDLLRGLVPPGRRAAARQAGTDSLLDRLGPLAVSERLTALQELVLVHVAAGLGHSSPERIDVDRVFKELGFDSLIAVEVRNRLAIATGLDLRITVIFDHPTARDLAAYLYHELFGELAETTGGGPVVVMEAADDPIVIVGMACRYPGGVSSPEDLWQLVTSGGDGVSAFPTNRSWDMDYWNRALAAAGRRAEGGFLHDATDFDAAFFGISPNEAMMMDPQQRMLLEVCWEALERTGVDPLSLRGSSTGVFAGTMGCIYDPGPSALAPENVFFRGTGALGSMVTGRVAYTLGLEGPAISVDTACSSSLVALHMAAQALRKGDCSLAMAGGVTLLFSPEPFAHTSGSSVDGRCKSFADSADGYGWSEGVGVVVLERMSDARQHGHEILAVVRATAVNQDGMSNGPTAPSGPAQERVIRRALAVAGLRPSDVDAVEGHGSGTTLGDPIEANALLATYGQDRAADRPLWLGSVKSNIGHAQAAAGVAGVIKMTMALRNGKLPRSRYAEEPTTGVAWSSGNVRLLAETIDWPVNGHPRRGGVSAFGLSGTNAHAILEEAPAPVASAAEVAGPVEERRKAAVTPPLLLCARTREAVPDQAERLLSYLNEHPQLDPIDVGYSLVTSRIPMPHRAVVAGADRDELLAGLAALAAAKPAPGVALGTVRPGRKTAFLFPGGGIQRAGMGRELYQAFPTFAWAFDEVSDTFDRYLDRPLHDVMFAAEGSVNAKLLNQMQFTLSAVFTMEVSLFRLLESWGQRPDYVLGHSAGELAAAHVSGVLSLKDAVKLTAHRAQLMQELPGGALVAVEASESEVQPMLTDRVSIAAINAPGSVVISGDVKPTLALARRLKRMGRRTNRLAVMQAAHSPGVDEMLDDLRDIARGLTYHKPRLPVVSTVTGALMTDEMCGPEYWVANCRQSVRFLDGVRALESAGVNRFIELGTDGTLSAMVESCLTETSEDAAAVPVLRGVAQPETVAIQLAAGQMYADGLGLDGARLFAGRDARRVPLPTYAFHRTRFWPDIDPKALFAGGDAASPGLDAIGHPVVGAATRLADADSVVLAGRVSVTSHPWLADHTVGGTVIFPGAAMVELAIRAGDEVHCRRLEELTLEAPMVLPEHGRLQIQAVVGEPDGSGARSITVHSRADDPGAPWLRHAAGLLAPDGAAVPAELLAWPPAGAEPIAVDGLYDALAGEGLAYGPTFQGLRAAWRLGDDVFADVSLDHASGSDAVGFGIHPAVLDAALHAIALCEPVEVAGGLPFAWTGVELHATEATTVRVRIQPLARDTVSIALADQTGHPVASVESLVLRSGATTSAALGSAAAATAHESLFTVDWVPVDVGAPDDGSAPDIRVLDRTSLGATAGAVHTATREMLASLRQWLDSDNPAKLVVVTRRASVLAGEEPADLAGAAVWGLVRAAQGEHPGRFVLADLDEDPESYRMLPALAARGEPEAVVRNGVVHGARLVRPRPGADAAPASTFDANGTTLVTGAGGVIGRLLARHLVTARGVRHLLLVGRGGVAPEISAELTALGASVTTAGCDVSDREAVARLLAGVPAAHPLTAVVHLAAVVQDATIAALTDEQIADVLRPKVDGTMVLHELTEGLDLSAFVVFSSAAGLLGSAGQANYAAANSFLDALAAYRQAQGKPAQSLAWGAWQTLDETILARFARAGLGALSDADGLALFDAATARPEALLVPMKVLPGVPDVPSDVPHLFRALVTPARRTAARAAQSDADSLRQRLAAMPEGQRERVLRALVVEHTAGLLGYADSGEIDPHRHFLELGFNSLAAVDLRNSIAASTGLRLPATVAFDLQNPAALAKHLLTSFGSLDGTATPTSASAPATGQESADPVSDGLKLLFSEAVRAGKAPEGLAMLNSVANLRPSFESVADVDPPVPVTLSEGSARPHLLCFATPVAMGGAHQYARIAAHFRDLRRVSVLPMPGFQPGELLPASTDAIIDVLTEAVRKAIGDEPVILLGYSSAGIFTHAVAGRLERSGVRPAGTILLDTYPVSEADAGDVDAGGVSRIISEMITGMLDRESQYGNFDRTRLTAMARYMDILPQVVLTDIAAPSLLLRPERGVGSGQADERWQTTWRRADADRTIPGDHFSMLAEDSTETARAIQEWIDEL